MCKCVLFVYLCMSCCSLCIHVFVACVVVRCVCRSSVRPLGSLVIYCVRDVCLSAFMNDICSCDTSVIFCVSDCVLS